jgi:DNA-binding SARP family transcriptional activator
MMLQQNSTKNSNTPQLSLSLLGPFKLAVNGQTVTSLVSEKLRAILAYLAVEAHQEHPRTILAGLVWPELPEQEALAHLRFALSNLRHVIGDRAAAPPFLLITRQSVEFNVASSHWLDVSTFQTLAGHPAHDAPADVARLEQAIALYRDSFLIGFSVRSGNFEEWVLLKREGFDRQALSVMQRLADSYERSGDYARAQLYARRQLELEPWREEAHCQLMRALALSGQRSSALAQYESCRRLLARDLAVMPGHEITVLYEAIRDDRLPRLSRTAESRPA